MAQPVAGVQKTVSRAGSAGDAIRQTGQSGQHAVGMDSENTDAIKEQSSASQNVARFVEQIAQMGDAGSGSATQGALEAKRLDSLAAEIHKVLVNYRL